MGMTKEQVLRLTKSMRTLDFTKEVSSLACPVKILVGEKDQANQKAAKNFKALYPKGDLTFIKGAGHEVNEDCPKKLAEEIQHFLLENTKVL